MTSQYQKRQRNAILEWVAARRQGKRLKKYLEEHRKLNVIWELRARERGWREGIMMSQVNLNLE